MTSRPKRKCTMNQRNVNPFSARGIGGVVGSGNSTLFSRQSNQTRSNYTFSKDELESIRSSSDSCDCVINLSSSPDAPKDPLVHITRRANTQKGRIFSSENHQPDRKINYIDEKVASDSDESTTNHRKPWNYACTSQRNVIVSDDEYVYSKSESYESPGNGSNSINLRYQKPSKENIASNIDGKVFSPKASEDKKCTLKRRSNYLKSSSSEDHSEMDVEVQNLTISSNRAMNVNKSSRKAEVIDKGNIPKTKNNRYLSESIESENLSYSTSPSYKNAKRLRTNTPKESIGTEEPDVSEDEAEQPTISKILACKSQTSIEWKNEMKSMNTSEILDGSIWFQEKTNVADDHVIERFLIKWTGLSYLHVSWETYADLHKILGAIAIGTISRFKSAPSPAYEAEFDGMYFNPEYTQIDRIIDIDEVKGLPSRYLIKWTNLSYADSTYELESDLKKCQIDYIGALMKHRAREVPMRQSDVRRDKHSLGFSKLTFLNGGTLRSYQEEGVKFMLVNWSKGRSSILADEMGLGKTLQTAAFLWHLFIDRCKFGPFLIIAPLSTIIHWQREIEQWTGMNAVVYHGKIEDREIIEEYEISFARKARVKSEDQKLKAVCIITTPDMIMKPDVIRTFSKIRFEILVVDEAHRLKNDASLLNKILSKSSGRYHWKQCLLLTGTPLQNNMEELWTLLNFVDMQRFQSKEEFIQKFGDMSQKSQAGAWLIKKPVEFVSIIEKFIQVEELIKTMKGYVLRRMKEDVEKDMPPKQETVIEVELTTVQKQYYRALYEQNTQFLLRGGKLRAIDKPSLINLAMQLRKCCNHPFLINGAEMTIAEEFKQSEKSNADVIVACSGKLVLLDKLLPRLKEQGHRVLVFSQFVIMLNILEDYLIGREYRYGRIDGNIVGLKRQRVIDEFQAEESDLFVMLLSTRAGGLGINLTAADTVIIYDSDWNPQNDLQAQARCHRIGQTKSVRVFRLISRKTYEEVMFKASSKKLGLDRAVLSQGRADRREFNIAAGEVENLLKKGAYYAFNDDDTATKKFCESDIDFILRNSQVITHESGSNGNSFSKASYQMDSGTGEEVNVDDPDFWTKVVGLTMPEIVDEKPLPKRAATIGKKYYREAGGPPVDSGLSDASVEDIEGSDSSTGRQKKEDVLKSSKSVLAAITNISFSEVWRVMLKRGIGKWDQYLPLLKKKVNEEQVKDAATSILSCVVLNTIRELYTTNVQTLQIDQKTETEIEQDKKLLYLCAIYKVISSHPSAQYLVGIPYGTTVSSETPDIQKMYEKIKAVQLNSCDHLSFLTNIKKPMTKLSQMDDLLAVSALFHKIQKKISGNCDKSEFPLWDDIVQNINASATSVWEFHHDIFILQSVEYYGWPTKKSIEDSLLDQRFWWSFTAYAEIKRQEREAKTTAATDGSTTVSTAQTSEVSTEKDIHTKVSAYPQVSQVIKRLRMLIASFNQLLSTTNDKLPRETSVTRAMAASAETALEQKRLFERKLKLVLMSHGIPLTMLKRDSPITLVEKSTASGDYLRSILNLTWDAISSMSGCQNATLTKEIAANMLRQALRRTNYNYNFFSFGVNAAENKVEDTATGSTDDVAFLEHTIRMTETRFLLMSRANSLLELSALASHLGDCLSQKAAPMSWWIPSIHDASLLLHSCVHGSGYFDSRSNRILSAMEFRNAAEIEFGIGSNLSPQTLLPLGLSLNQILPLGHYIPPLSSSDALCRIEALQQTILSTVLDQNVLSTYAPTNKQNSATSALNFANRVLPQLPSAFFMMSYNARQSETKSGNKQRITSFFTAVQPMQQSAKTATDYHSVQIHPAATELSSTTGAKDSQCRNHLQNSVNSVTNTAPAESKEIRPTVDLKQSIRSIESKPCQPEAISRDQCTHITVDDPCLTKNGTESILLTPASKKISEIRRQSGDPQKDNRILATDGKIDERSKNSAQTCLMGVNGAPDTSCDVNFVFEPEKLG